MLKKFKLRLAGWNLDRRIKNGSAPHGRTEGFVAPRRSLWLELCLRVRVITAAVRSTLPWAGEVTPVGRLYASVKRADGTTKDLGCVSTKVVTDAGVQYIVDALQNLATIHNLRFHASGTGTNAESAANTTLQTEVASRVSGTQAEGASANIFRTVATIPYSGTFAITEHGIFSASSSGTLLDRSVFAAINVQSGDSIEFTYELTLPSGS